MARYLEQRLKIRHLRVIEAADSCKSLLQASQVLGVSQSALTRTLQEVEEIIGEPIFERHARGVRANEVGTLLALGARDLLSTLRRMEDDLAARLQVRKQSITVGALPVAAHGLLPAVVSHTSRRTAELSVHLVEGRTDQLIPALNQGEIDVIVGRLYEPAIPDGLIRRVLYYEPISLMARADHPIFERLHIEAQDVAGYDLILPSVSSILEREVRQALEGIDLPEARIIQSSSVGFMRELLLTSNFITAMPRVLVAGDLARGAFRVLPVALRARPRPAGLIYRADLGVAGDLIISELARELARLSDEGIVYLPDPILETDAPL